MKSDTSLKLIFVGIPKEEFSTWPQDRSLQKLAEDARALRRRASKGVGTKVQRGLFVQLARRLDSLATQLNSANTVVLEGHEVEAWLSVEQNISALLPTVAEMDRVRDSLGEQLLFPGDQVARYFEFVASLSVDRLCAYCPQWKKLQSSSAKSLLEKVVNFYELANKKNFAVSHVLISATSA